MDAQVRTALETVAKKTSEAKSARVSTRVKATYQSGRLRTVEGVRSRDPLLTDVEITGMPLGGGQRGDARELRFADG